MDIKGFMLYIKEEFPGVIDTHWDWDLLENIITYAVSKYNVFNEYNSRSYL